jgi:hypothetical protein
MARTYPKSDPVMHGQMFVHSDVFEVSREETDVCLLDLENLAPQSESLVKYHQTTVYRK